jgi:hypothetical protein
MTTVQPGDNVYCHGDFLGVYATVVKTNTLGLQLGVTACGGDGVHRLYCGKEIQNCCDVIPLIVQEMKKLGMEIPDIHAIKAAWFQQVSDAEQRIRLKEDLLSAIDNDASVQFVADLRQLLGINS